ncbi:MAG TPA: hypothetical protein VNL91_11395 [Thermoanaerobaculia bacterium]|nr:hypothetical protein [Thermoanaerobaculia bacterium]
MTGSFLFRVGAVPIGFVAGIVATMTFLHDLGRFAIEPVAARIGRHV